MLAYEAIKVGGVINLTSTKTSYIKCLNNTKCYVEKLLIRNNKITGIWLIPQSDFKIVAKNGSLCHTNASDGYGFPITIQDLNDDFIINGITNES